MLKRYNPRTLINPFKSIPTTRRLDWSRNVSSIRNIDIKDDEIRIIKVNRERLWRELHYTCQWGKGERWGVEETDKGMSRLALSYADKLARDWFVETMKELGCDVKIDAMEEGARFPVSMVSSGVWANDIPLLSAHNLREINGPATMKSELERIGYLGLIPASYKENLIGVHFELHIEQGPILEKSKTRIGAVTGVQAYRWHTITVRGSDCHTGILNLKPGSTNTVPGFVQFSLDIRCSEDERLLAFEKELRKDFELIAAGAQMATLGASGKKGKGCTLDWQVDTDSPATHFNKDCIRCVEESAGDLIETTSTAENQPGAVSNTYMRMVSGAGHDRSEYQSDDKGFAE
ncbi:hypothetical protein SS1G_10491 [Sclerotinia sclerotiorum 1980 UF-70]|uniref:Peptidase M20 dimerisation domain-containing protein n=1 Tax=Sclerotinia sclerotiorum (strain ATCC 18683 / 1980 / Ss-1) TaxID=665079 RepID=A7EYS5_SCLS1|nr:hypothetical protein SS1G_10491 [Sclerotinia sclerotiorum 1980 UF-70]EDN94617.1 hypothetical protein SS1G_10491 [Sclerotinia sclerotiorum 1980 UF-70]